MIYNRSVKRYAHAAGCASTQGHNKEGEKREGESLMIGANYFDCFLFAERFDSNHSSPTSPAGPSSEAVVEHSAAAARITSRRCFQYSKRWVSFFLPTAQNPRLTYYDKLQAFDDGGHDHCTEPYSVSVAPCEILHPDGSVPCVRLASLEPAYR